LVDLVHDGLEAGETSGQDQASEGKGRLVVVPQRQKVGSGIGAGDDDDILATIILLVAVLVAAGLVQRRSGVDLRIGCSSFFCVSVLAVASGGGDDRFLVDGLVTGDFHNLALNRIDGARHEGAVGPVRHCGLGRSSEMDKERNVRKGEPQSRPTKTQTAVRDAVHGLGDRRDYKRP
jgi:hypothetical protein